MLLDCRSKSRGGGNIGKPDSEVRFRDESWPVAMIHRRQHSSTRPQPTQHKNLFAKRESSPLRERKQWVQGLVGDDKTTFRRTLVTGVGIDQLTVVVHGLSIVGSDQDFELEFPVLRLID